MVPQRRHLPFLLGAIAVAVAGNALGAAFAPVLLAEAPLALIALSPLGRHLILVATVTPIGAFVVVAALRRALGDVMAYWLGYIHGEEGMPWIERRFPRAAGLVRVVERAFRRAGPVLLFILPGLSFSALAGMVRMPFGLFITLVVTSQALWMLLTFYLGDALRPWIEPVVAFLNEHVATATLVCALLVGGYVLYRRRFRRGNVLSELAAAADDVE